MARFTSAFISGTLYALCSSGTAPSTAISAAWSAVALSRGLPLMKASTAFKRYGVADTPLTTMRASLIVEPETFIAAAMLTSAKSHT